MDADFDNAPNAVCPNCDGKGVRIFTGVLACADCEHVEVVAHREDEDEAVFFNRLHHAAARWQTTQDRIIKGTHFDPYSDAPRDWS